MDFYYHDPLYDQFQIWGISLTYFHQVLTTPCQHRDAVGGYLFHDHPREIDHHLALGVSLGGHSIWQLMFADERIRAGIAVIGCPDFMSRSPIPTLHIPITNKRSHALRPRQKVQTSNLFRRRQRRDLHRQQGLPTVASNRLSEARSQGYSLRHGRGAL